MWHGPTEAVTGPNTLWDLVFHPDRYAERREKSSRRRGMPVLLKWMGMGDSSSVPAASPPQVKMAQDEAMVERGYWVQKRLMNPLRSRLNMGAGKQLNRMQLRCGTCTEVSIHPGALEWCSLTIVMFLCYLPHCTEE